MVVARNLGTLASEESLAGSHCLGEFLQLGVVEHAQTVEGRVGREFASTHLGYLKTLLVLAEQEAVGGIGCQLIVFHLAAVNLVIILDSFLEATSLVENLGRNDVNGIVGANLAEFLEFHHSHSGVGLAVDLGITTVALNVLGVHHSGLLKPSGCATTIVLGNFDIAHEHVARTILAVDLQGILGQSHGIGGILDIKISAAEGCQCLSVLLVVLAESLNLILDSSRIGLVFLNQFTNVLDVTLHIL